MTSLIAAITSTLRSQGFEVEVPGAPVVTDDDTVAVAGGDDVTINILANDDLGDALKADVTVNLTTTGLTDSAAAVVDGNNDVTFTPSASPSTQEFTYTVTNAVGTSTAATVTVTVQATPGDELGAQMLALTPRSYWRHADTNGAVLADSSGNGNDGAIFGAPTFGVDPELDEITNLDRAITYVGASYAECPSAAAAVITRSIRWKATATDIANEAWIFHRNTTGNVAGNWAFRYSAGGGGRFFCQQGGSSQVDIDVPAGTFVDGNWYHLWVRMDATGAYVRLNGSLVGSTTAHTIGDGAADLPLVIGLATNGTQFVGTVHEVAEYAAALTDEQMDARAYYDDTGAPGDDGALGETNLPTASNSTTATNDVDARHGARQWCDRRDRAGERQLCRVQRHALECRDQSPEPARGQDHKRLDEGECFGRLPLWARPDAAHADRRPERGERRACLAVPVGWRQRPGHPHL
ncbi:MAG: LamG domain-containing protein [Nitrosarchaeum sp.]|nr:LamG domain-containing protein [Nitrosarchaeum sp.]